MTEASCLLVVVPSKARGGVMRGTRRGAGGGLVLSRLPVWKQKKSRGRVEKSPLVPLPCRRTERGPAAITVCAAWLGAR